MKKIPLILVCLCLIASPVFAFGPAIQAVVGASSTPAGCTTGAESCAASTTSSYGCLQSSAQVYLASKFVAEATETVCSAVLRMKRSTDTDPTHSYNVYIYSNSCTTCDRSDDNVGSVVGTGSTNSITYAANLTTTEADVTFTGISASITSGEVYWVVLKGTGTVDSTNYGLWGCSTGCTTKDFRRDADGAGAWGSVSATYGGKYTLYK
jgi:hypothetical protein